MASVSVTLNNCYISTAPYSSIVRTVQNTSFTVMTPCFTIDAKDLIVKIGR